MRRVEEASTLNQPIRLTIHECLMHRPDARDAIRAHEKERYGYDYEPTTAVSMPLTTSIASPCFGYEVITHPFPRPFIMHSMDKYSGDAKPDHWLSDYLTDVDMAEGGMGNALWYVPLCLTESARTWLNGLPPHTIYYWMDFEEALLHNFEWTYQCLGSA